MFIQPKGQNPKPGRGNVKASNVPDETVLDWQQIGTFVAGLGIGASVGAAIALLWAPDSGDATRGKIRRKFAGAGDETLWESLGNELKRAAAKTKPIEDEDLDELEEIELISEAD